jgi:hypothetical protein
MGILAQTNQTNHLHSFLHFMSFVPVLLFHDVVLISFISDVIRTQGGSAAEIVHFSQERQ